jgi:thymidylate synthase (FAD)
MGIEGMIFTSDIPVSVVQNVGSDAAVVAAARVSVRGPEARIDDSEMSSNRGLIRYLMRQRHGTPFEHASMTFFVHAPIFVWREWHRHRIGFSYNEESGRYKVLEPRFYIPPRDRPMFKIEDWKPGRPKFLPILNQVGEAAYDKLCRNLREVYTHAYSRYEENLGLGIDPGLARDCLPVGIYSSCWVTCNPRSVMAFLSLRTHEPAASAVSYPLYEIEMAARAVEAEFAKLFPLTYEAFCDFGRVAP